MVRRPALLAALALLLLPACGRDVQPTGAGGATTSFVYVRGKDSPGLDPAEATDGESALVLVNVFDTLVRFRHGSAETEPALAASWTIADDRRTATFTLRSGVRFHDDTPCDAAAVATSFERQRDPKHPFHWGEGRYPYWGDLFGFVARCTAPDPATVRFEFSAPAPPFFLSLLAMFNASIVSPTALAKGKEHVARHPVGTGAFRFAAWRNEEITLEANAGWWGGKPALDRLSLVVVPDLRTALLRLENGQAHGIDNVASRDVPKVRANPALALHQVDPGLSVCYLSMNNDAKPFDDVRVRRAVALAIDKRRIVDAAYDGMASPLVTLVPPGIPFSAPLSDRVRDVPAAKALLTEAGAVGAKVTLRFPSNPRPYLPNPDALAAQLRDDLREIGLEVELRKEEWSAYLKLMQNGEHQLGVLGWTPDVADADNYLYVLLSKENAVKGSANNNAFYRSEAFHERVAKARASADPAERRRLYEEAQRIAFDDAPLVPLIVQPRTSATRANVRGFIPEQVSSPRFAWVTFAR